MTVFLSLLLLLFAGSAELCAYRSPTERFIEAHSWQTIDKQLKKLSFTSKEQLLLTDLPKSETIGFLGYHGSTQDYRIFQDLIRLILEEHLKLSIRKDFHFLRLPGHPQFDEPSAFLCLNYTLYGNFKSATSNSCLYFAHNCSSTKIDYEKTLSWLFEQIGLNTSQIKPLFAVGRRLLPNKRGILLQLFDRSTPPYAFADEQCESCAETPFSEVVTREHPTTFPEELHLLLQNRYALNPNSPLSIQRYDGLSSTTTKRYERKLRDAVRALHPDPEKVEQYKKTLFASWQSECKLLSKTMH